MSGTSENKLASFCIEVHSQTCAARGTYRFARCGHYKFGDTCTVAYVPHHKDSYDDDLMRSGSEAESSFLVRSAESELVAGISTLIADVFEEVPMFPVVGPLPSAGEASAVVNHKYGVAVVPIYSAAEGLEVTPLTVDCVPAGGVVSLNAPVGEVVLEHDKSPKVLVSSTAEDSEVTLLTADSVPSGGEVSLDAPVDEVVLEHDTQANGGDSHGPLALKENEQIDKVLDALALRPSVGPGDEKLSSPMAPIRFKVTLRKVERTDALGMNVRPDGQHLQITEVSTGLAQEWNSAHWEVVIPSGVPPTLSFKTWGFGLTNQFPNGWRMMER